VRWNTTCNTLREEKSFKSPVDKKKYRKIEFQLCILLGNAALDFEVTYKDEFVGAVAAQYAENLHGRFQNL